MYLENKKIHLDFEIKDSFKCGLVLKGKEPKLIRNQNISITTAYCTIIQNEIFVRNLFTTTNALPKLLLNRKEIKKIIGLCSKKGMIAIIQSIFEERGMFKMNICLAIRLKKHDKREFIKKREMSKRSFSEN